MINQWSWLRIVIKVVNKELSYALASGEYGQLGQKFKPTQCVTGLFASMDGE
jgi:hypothetical protein